MSVDSIGTDLRRLSLVGLLMIAGWVDTHLDPQRRARGDIRQLIVQAMDAL